MSKANAKDAVYRAKCRTTWSTYELVFFKYIQAMYEKNKFDDCKGYLDDLNNFLIQKQAILSELRRELFKEEK
mgnify:CR=1 FL=1